jgi:hypothetical protein
MKASPAARMGRAEKVKACIGPNDSLCKSGGHVLTLSGVGTAEIWDDNFWGDISKPSIHNLQTSGSYQPKIVRLPAKGR